MVLSIYHVNYYYYIFMYVSVYILETRGFGFDHFDKTLRSESCLYTAISLSSLTRFINKVLITLYAYQVYCVEWCVSKIKSIPSIILCAIYRVVRFELVHFFMTTVRICVHCVMIIIKLMVWIIRNWLYHGTVTINKHCQYQLSDVLIATITNETGGRWIDIDTSKCSTFLN